MFNKNFISATGAIFACFSLLIAGCSKKGEEVKSSCPNGYFYIGNGYCKEMRCFNGPYSEYLFTNEAKEAKRIAEENGISCPNLGLPIQGNNIVPALK